jgi:DNA-binding PadR family transcriptional regulator
MSDRKLPTDQELHLLALVISEQTGREIVKAYEGATGKRMPYGTAYTYLDAMEKKGWVASREDVRGGRRVRLYRLLGNGNTALADGRAYHERLASFGRLDGAAGIA